MDLVIVESPTKAKTLSKFLGRKFVVTASQGHIIDLPKKKLGVAVEDNFKPEYEPTPRAKKVIADIKKKALEAEKIYLATDPDREGEAIAWHLLSVINGGEKKSKKKKETLVSEAKGLKPIERVVFHEITKEAVEDAFAHPRAIDEHLFDAQQARRVLDRLVGYKLSPLLWRKVRFGLSAGRVQSVAVRLVVVREDERKKFVPKEYWSFDVLSSTSLKEEFLASLTQIDGKKPDISAKEQMDNILAQVTVGAKLQVKKIEKTQKKRYPYPPFTTSTLTQAASNRFGFTAKRTMMAAQRLFEAGFITYHRTDSFNLSLEFLSRARGVITQSFGAEFLPGSPNYYKNRSRNAQEAHEAIRPTNPNLKSVRGEEATEDGEKVYELIYKRAMSSQMLPAVFDAVGVDLVSLDGRYGFRASGSKLKFEGWLKIYGASLEEEDSNGSGTSEEKNELSNRIPELKEGELVSISKLLPEQHFTQPPPRYTEASLIKTLEEDGIGRPSTYAPTISTILDRGYVKKEGKYFVPEDVAIVVTKLLAEHFPQIVDEGFTANMEDKLDEIADGVIGWVPVVRDFYTPFIASVETKEKELSKKDMTLLEETTEVCPECGKNLVVKLGKYGRFYSCSGFPECKYAKPIVVGVGGENGDFVADESQLGKCPLCEDGVLGVKDGRFGRFIACSNYSSKPKCKFAKPYLEKVGIKCPDCGVGDVVVKKGKFKRLFYSCSRYPECKFVSNKKPEEKSVLST
ncbi:MAG: type I DNA topoisomerase [Patescibacteria group bacterium]